MPNSAIRGQRYAKLPRLIILVVTVLICSLASPSTAQDGGKAAPLTPVGPNPADQDPADQNPAEQYRQQAIERWAEEIQRLEQRDVTETDTEDGILFIGSSSIRLWDEIAQDMAPYETIERGYGGAQFSDLAVFAERIIQPHEYRALVVFVANDVTGQRSDKSPEEIERLVRYIIDVARRHQPTAPVFLIEVTPTSSRYKAWPKIRAVNAMLREVALAEPDVHFIATAEHYLGEDNRPIDRLFREDRLHLSREGYEIWAKLIRRRLDDVLGPAD